MKKIFNFLLVSAFFILLFGQADSISTNEVSLIKEEAMIYDGNKGIIADNDVLIGSMNYPDIGYKFTYNGKSYVVENYAYEYPFTYMSSGIKQYYVCTDPQNKYFMIRTPDMDLDFNNDDIIEKIDNAGSPWKLSTCTLPYVKNQPYIYSYQSGQGYESFDYYFYYSPTKLYNIGHRSMSKIYTSHEKIENFYGNPFKFNSDAKFMNLDKLNKTLGSKDNINDIDDAFYFEKLKNNFGNNKYGSCSYIAIAMMLGYYDSLLDDRFVTNNYIKTTSVYSQDITEVISPGTTEAYHQYLLGIGSSLGLSYGIYSRDFLPLFNKSLQHMNNVSVDYLLNYNHQLLGNNNALSINQIENGVINHINNNNPVILLLSEWEYNTYSFDNSGNIVINSNVSYSYLGHAMVAYGYVTYNGETYFKCHLGWYAPTTDVLVKINGGEVSAIAMEYTEDGNHQCSKAYLYDVDGSCAPMCFCTISLDRAKFVNQPFDNHIDTLSFETTKKSQLYAITFSTNFKADLYINGERIDLIDEGFEDYMYTHNYKAIVKSDQIGTQRIVIRTRNYNETNLTYAIFISEVDKDKIIGGFFEMGCLDYIDKITYEYEIDRIDVVSKTIIFKNITLKTVAEPGDCFYNSYISDIGIGIVAGTSYPNGDNCYVIFIFRINSTSNIFIGTENDIIIRYSETDFNAFQ